MHQYQLKKKIASDAKTKTYKAKDLKLARDVVLVILRNNLSDKDTRDFLLRARSIGILNHPGILPVYDMGLIGGSYFYCYRPAPDASLTKKLFQAKDKNWIFINSRSFRLQVLENLAGTVSYAHSLGISVGKLDFNSIVIGNHGEIIISDWSKSRWIKSISEADRKATFEEWVQEDLQQLAELGMRLYLLSDAPRDLSLRQWGQVSNNLPADLLVALDRAYLGRPSMYDDVKEFQKDIDNHIKGKPSLNFQGDFITSAKGLYRQNSKVGFYFISLCLFCFFSMIILTVQVGGIAGTNNDREINITKLKGNLDVLREEVDEMEDKKNQLETDMQSLEDELEWNKKKKAKHKEDEAQKKKELEETTKTFASLQGELDAILKDIKKEDSALAENISVKLNKINRSIREKTAKINKLKKHESYRIHSYNMDSEKQIAYRSQLGKMLKNKGWLSDYLTKESKKETTSKSSNKETLTMTPENLTINPKGNMVAWKTTNKIYIYDLSGKPTLHKFSVKETNITSLKFSSDENHLHAVNEDFIIIYKYQAEEDELEVVLKVDNNDDFKNLISYTPIYSLGFLDGTNLNYLVFNPVENDFGTTWEQQSFNRPLAPEARLISSPKEKHFLIINDRIYIFPNLRPVNYTGPAIKLTQGSHIFYSHSENTLTLYEPNLDSEWNKRIDHMHSCTVEDPIKSVFVNNSKNACLIEFEDGAKKIWSYKDNNELQDTNLKGQPVLFFNNKILLQDNKTLSYEYFGAADEEKPDNNFGDVFKEKSEAIDVVILKDETVINSKTLTCEYKLMDIAQPNPDIPVAFILNGPNRVELWDLSEKIRLDVVAISETKLNRIYYSKEHNRIFGLDQDSKVHSW